MGRPHVVIVGGGFAGLYAARALRRAPVDVTLVDRRNHHVFQPLLYQVAAAGLTAPDIAAPIRSVLRRQRNARVLLAEVRDIDVERRCLRLDAGELDYDFLLLAPGSTPDYFGHDEWQEFAPSLKSLEDALAVRARILLAFEAAEREPDPGRRAAWLTFVVVGAGPTGVELAGALRDIAARTLTRDFRSFDSRQARVVLLDALERVLPTFPPQLSARAHAALERLCVEVRTGRAVTAVDALGVELAGGERIAARTVLWACGVRPSPLGAALGPSVDPRGRVRVAPDLSVPGHPEILVAGDLARVERDGQPIPALAAVAIQEGRHAARVIRADLEGRPRPVFHYRDRGVLATVGRRSAVASVYGLRLSGWLGWLAWAVVHIAWLIGFRNRLVVLFEWGWAYLTHQRAARLILGRSGSPLRVEPGPRSG
jgi:NADH dehydrogenase